MLETGRRWKAKEEEANKSLAEGQWGWKIATADVWHGILDAAGGETEDHLNPFFM